MVIIEYIKNMFNENLKLKNKLDNELKTIVDKYKKINEMLKIEDYSKFKNEIFNLFSINNLYNFNIYWDENKNIKNINHILWYNLFIWYGEDENDWNLCLQFSFEPVPNKSLLKDNNQENSLLYAVLSKNRIIYEFKHENK